MALEKVLVVDDDPNICEVLRMYLENEGYSVILSYDGEEALVKFNALKPDVILLDVMLPSLDGWQVCREVRKKSSVPIIMITAKGDTFDKVLGLELGADDYICKPFRPRELLARINTVLRRKNGKSEFLSCKDITVDVQKAVVRKGNTELFLSALEYRLLLVFLQNPGVVFSRKKLLEMIWDVTGDFISDNTLTVYMKRLRDKLKPNPQEPEINNYRSWAWL